MNLPLPAFESRDRPNLFSHSTLTENAEEDFKDAKWVVLTSPLVQNKVAGKGNQQL
jgi:hypothetical protein